MRERASRPPSRSSSLVYSDSSISRTRGLDWRAGIDSTFCMVRGGFLSANERRALVELARDGLAESRLTRRANAIILLDQGWSCVEVAEALLFDDDTVRSWFRAYEKDGVEGLRNFGHEGSSCRMNEEQQAALKAWVSERLPRSTNLVGAWLEKTYGVCYSHAALIALLHRLGFEFRKPQAMPRGLDDATQQAHIDGYEKLVTTMGPDEAVAFIDAAHPTHQVRPAGCWAPKDVAIAVEQTTGRDRVNIHGAINLETGKTHMLVVDKVNAQSFIKLLSEMENSTAMRVIHAFVDRASYHRADIVKEWLARAGRKIVLHLLPPYCPHLNPIERLWGLMHKKVTHNRDYKTFREFRREVLKFLRQTVPKNWKRYCDRITDNFRVIHRADFRVIA
jgi:transposase